MEKLERDVLGVVLKFLNLYEIAEVTMLSKQMNKRVAEVVNVKKPSGREWWFKKLAEDHWEEGFSMIVGDLPKTAVYFDQEGNPKMTPFDVYFALTENIVNQVRFAAKHSPVLLKYLEEESSDRYVQDMPSPEDIAEILKLAPRIVWAIFDANRDKVIDVIYTLVADSDVNIVNDILHYPNMEHDDIYVIVHDIVDGVIEGTMPENSAVMILDNPLFYKALADYNLIRDIIEWYRGEEDGTLLLKLGFSAGMIAEVLHNRQER